MKMTAREFKNRIKGVIPVQLCPYTKEGGVDIEGIKENTKFIVDFAKDGNKDVALFTNGSTTEFYANSIEEQKRVIKTVVDTVDGKIPAVAGVPQADEENKNSKKYWGKSAITLKPSGVMTR